MLRMQEMAVPGFKFQKMFWGNMPPDPLFMRGMSAAHVTFGHCYPPLIYYLIERSLFKPPPPTRKILRKGPAVVRMSVKNVLNILICSRDQSIHLLSYLKM
jgi:hypothetical protein